VTVFVAGHRLVGFVQLKLGAGRVEEQQVHFQIKQAGQLPEHLALQLVWTSCSQSMAR
jgi:hypothetical protein